MTLDNAIYPTILLPYRVLYLCKRVMRFATNSADEDKYTSFALEREFKAIIYRENVTISKICFAYSGTAAEFEDLRQDALINIWRGLQKFRGEASERTWIYRVTVNSCISTIRKQSRYKHESLESLYGLIESDESKKDAIEQIHRAISRLNSQEKAMIMMWLDELSYEDIADAMGLNRNTVATKIRRIKDKIVREYKTEDEL